MLPNLLVDKDGRINTAHSPSLRRWLGSSLPFPALAEFAVKNLGYVALHASRCAARVWMRPKVVKQEAVLGTLMWLGDQPAERVVLTVFDKAWSDRLLKDRMAGMQAIVDAVLPSAARAQDFVRQDRSPHTLGNTGLAALRERWSEVDGRFDLQALMPTLFQHLQDRYVVVKVDGPDIRLVGCGMGMPMLPRAWRRICIGQRLQDIYDTEFGRWGVQAYHRAAQQSAPLLDDIDIIGNLPGHPRTRITYTRIILPIIDERGEQFLLGASLTDPNVNLRAGFA